MRRQPEGPTAAEVEALAAVVKHGSMRGAAKQLFIAPSTIKSRLDRLREMTGLHTEAQMAALALARGWLTEQDLLPGSPRDGG